MKTARILSGKEIVEEGIVTGHLPDAIQPNGVDLSIDELLQPQPEPATLADAKTRYTQAKPLSLPATITAPTIAKIAETVSLPNNAAAFAWPRSSLLRLGAFCATGVFDAGYTGKPGVLLVPSTPLTLNRRDRITQLVVFVQPTPLGQYAGSYLYEGLKTINGLTAVADHASCDVKPLSDR